MKNNIRRIIAIALAALFVFALTACSAADIVSGFVDAATYMSDETNIRTESDFKIILSENAKPVSFSGLVNAIISEGPDVLPDFELGMSVLSEIYEDSGKFVLSWLGSDGTAETLMTIVTVDDMVYIGLELLGYIRYIDELSEFAPLLAFFNYDYITIDVNYLYELLEIDPADMMQPEINTADLEAMMRSAMTKLDGILRNYTPQVLTKEVITKDSDKYTLTLDAESAIELIGEILNIASQNEDAIKDFLYSLFEEMTVYLDDTIDIPEEIGDFLDDLDFSQLSSLFDDAVADVIIGEDIPDFNLSLSVSGIGRGDEKKQVTNTSFVMKDFAQEDFPIDKLAFEINNTTTITQQPVSAPTGNIVSIEELIALFSLFDMF